MDILPSYHLKFETSLSQSSLLQKSLILLVLAYICHWHSYQLEYVNLANKCHNLLMNLQWGAKLFGKRPKYENNHRELFGHLSKNFNQGINFLILDGLYNYVMWGFQMKWTQLAYQMFELLLEKQAGFFLYKTWLLNFLFTPISYGWTGRRFFGVLWYTNVVVFSLQIHCWCKCSLKTIKRGPKMKCFSIRNCIACSSRKLEITRD